MSIQRLLGLLMIWGMISCGSTESNEQVTTEETIKEVNVYSHRFYDTDKALFAEFEKETGIKVNVKEDKADKLIALLQSEGENTSADVLITVDAGRLHYAKELGLSQSVQSAQLNSNVPEHLRDSEGHWYALTKRARVMMYNTETTNPDDLPTYENLTDDAWKGQIFIRSSSNIYNQSLLASVIARYGEEEALNWAKGVVSNMAREPKGNDRDQIKEVAAGNGLIAIANSYYLGKMLNSENEMEKEAGGKVGIFFPNQDAQGTHINVSGALVTKHAPNKDNAIQLLEFLSDVKAQNTYSESNYEYPVNPNAKTSDLLLSWGSFKEDTIRISELGKFNAAAVETFKAAGWD